MDVPASPAYRTLIPIFAELRGPRVLVRPYRESDADALHEAIDESRDHVRPWLPFADQHQSVDETRDWIIRMAAHWLLRESFECSLWEATTGRYLGGLGLHPRDWELGYFEIGYWLRASAQGHGYVSEAVRLVGDYVFTSLGARRLEIRCDARNRRSAGVAERMGFAHEATLRNQMRAPDGRLRTTRIYGLLDTDPRWQE